MKFQCPDLNTGDSKEIKGPYNSRSYQNSKRIKAAKTENNGAIYARLRIQGVERACLIDSGSEVSIIPLKWSEGMGMLPSQRSLRAVNGTKISLYGEIEAEVGVGTLTVSASMLVTDQIDTVILGLDWIIANSCVVDFCSGELQMGDECVQLQRSTRIDRC